MLIGLKALFMLKIAAAGDFQAFLPDTTYIYLRRDFDAVQARRMAK